MISVKDEKISVNGCKVELMAELTALINMLVDSGFDWQDIELIVETAKMSPEQLEKATVENLNEFIKWLENL